MRRFAEFRYREAAFIVATSRLEAVRQEIKKIRRDLETYIRLVPQFRTTLTPLKELPGEPPEAALRMHMAALATGVGPMAAVAGTVAQMAAEAAARAGCDDTIINNGGDLFLRIKDEAVVGIYGGGHALAGKAAFRILPETTPLAICSSSSKMGHSSSFGRCDLATVCAADGALADAAATLAGNLSRDAGSAEAAAAKIAAIPGITGILILTGDSVAMAGELPPLVPCSGDTVQAGVLLHPDYNKEK